MACNITCSNNGVCSFNNTCRCLPCFAGDRCEIYTNIMKFSFTYTMVYDIQFSYSNPNFNITQFCYTTVISIMLVVALINNLACLQTFLKHDIRTSNCGLLQILYCITGLAAVFCMELRLLSLIHLDSLVQASSYRIVICNIVPVTVNTMGDICIWLSTAIALELLLLERFNLNLHRPRWYAVISAIIIYAVTISTHIHESLSRSSFPDPVRPDLYTCIYTYSPLLDIVDKSFRICHIIIPLSIHLIVTICMIISLTQRTLLVRDRDDFFSVFIQQVIKRKHFFIPPLFIIIANLPHLILHLKDQCEDARDKGILRAHVSFKILVYLPVVLTFFIYIYPSESYMHQFKTTRIGRWLKRTFHWN